MHPQRAVNPRSRLTLSQVRDKLDVLLNMCDVLAEQLEQERDRATHAGNSGQANGLQRGLLQVVRVRNDVRVARRDLDAVASSEGGPKPPLAA